MRRSHADGTERLGELDQVGVVEVGSVGAAELRVQIARHVAVGVVTEDDGRHVDAVLHGRGEFRLVEQETAVPNHADHGSVGLGDLHPQRRRERVADVELLAGVDVRLRVGHLVVRAGVVAELRDHVGRGLLVAG